MVMGECQYCYLWWRVGRNTKQHEELICNRCHKCLSPFASSEGAGLFCQRPSWSRWPGILHLSVLGIGYRYSQWSLHHWELYKEVPREKPCRASQATSTASCRVNISFQTHGVDQYVVVQCSTQQGKHAWLGEQNKLLFYLKLLYRSHPVT